MNETVSHLNRIALPFLRFVEPEPLSDWADENRYIADGASPEPGRWRTARTPYMKDILDACTDPNVRQVSICAGVQIGKTEALLSAIAYYMQHDPTTIMLVEPNESLVTDIGVDRVDSMIMESPELKKIFKVAEGAQKSKKKAQLKQHMKRFPGGYLFLASSASPSALKSRSIRVVLCDEIDTYPIRPDGHPVDLAINRSTTFIDSKVIMVSSPTTLQTSEIWRRVGGAGAQYEYRIPCPECGEFHAWKWPMVKWDDNNPATARMVCPTCGGLIRGSGAASDALLGRGAWFLTHGDASSDSKGFIVSGLLSPWKPLSGIVKEWIDAHRDRDVDRLRTFLQERLAEPWDAERHSFAPQLAGRTDFDRFESTPDHSRIRLLTAGVDVQRDRLECSVIGWGASSESWVVDHTIIYGDPLSDEVWQQLARYLARPPVLSDGRCLPMLSAAVDSGDGVTTTAVYRFCSKLASRNVIAIKGMAKEDAKMLGTPSRTAVKGATVYPLGVNRIKDIINERLSIQTGGPGYIHIPATLSGEYWKQLNSEKADIVIEHGRSVRRWVKTRDRNEALDCFVYALAAYSIFSARLTSAKSARNTRTRCVR